MSEKELQEKREKGLCFRCDGKWKVGHQCNRSELSVLMVAEGTVETMEEEELEGWIEEKEDDPVHTQLSMKTMVGLSSPRTMKLLGKIKGREVVTMIDPGATHNFISKEVVEALNLPVSSNGVFEVSLGNGDAVRGNGECKGVQLHLGNTIIEEDFFPLSLGNSEVVLGVQWLQKLGKVVNDWAQLTMKYNIKGQEVELRGDPALERSQITLKAMFRAIRKEKGGFLAELTTIKGEIPAPWRGC